MKYLCLVYFEENKLREMSKSEFETFMNECVACAEEYQEGGHMIAGAQLQPVQTAMTLRVQKGKICTTDGPFAETKEQLGGFCLIEARDLNEAIQVAAKMPPARLGCIEVRPVNESVHAALVSGTISRYH
jgi:hypothetical protein